MSSQEMELSDQKLSKELSPLLGPSKLSVSLTAQVRFKIFNEKQNQKSDRSALTVTLSKYNEGI